MSGPLTACRRGRSRTHQAARSRRALRSAGPRGTRPSTCWPSSLFIRLSRFGGLKWIEPNACWLALGCEGGGQRGNHGFSRYWPSRAMTFLELLAAPAPAGIVAADLLFVGDDTLLLRGDGGRAAAHRAG